MLIIEVGMQATRNRTVWKSFISASSLFQFSWRQSVVEHALIALRVDLRAYKHHSFRHAGAILDIFFAAKATLIGW